MIDLATARRLAERVAAEAGVTLVWPETWPGLLARATLAAGALVAPAVGLRTWDPRAVAERVSVALGPPASVVLVSPAALADPVDLVATVVHEAGHHHQALTLATPGDPAERGDGWPWPSAVAWPVLYLREPEARARAEADQYAADEWVARRLGRPGRSTTAALDALRAGYHLGPGDLDLAADILRSHWATLDAGARPAVWSVTLAARVLGEAGL